MLKLSLTIFPNNLSKVVLIATILFAGFTSGNSQTIKKSVICSGGSYSIGSQFILSQTVGESPSSILLEDAETILIQGFENQDIDTITVGINIDGIKLETNIYPVPTYGPLNIDFNITNKQLNLTVSLYNLQAKLMETFTITESFTTLNLKEYPAATYLLVFKTNDGLHSQSQLIEKIN